MKELVNNYFDWLKEKILVDEFVLNEEKNNVMPGCDDLVYRPRMHDPNYDSNKGKKISELGNNKSEKIDEFINDLKRNTPNCYSQADSKFIYCLEMFKKLAEIVKERL
jgi:hypothetical protein